MPSGRGGSSPLPRTSTNLAGAMPAKFVLGEDEEWRSTTVRAGVAQKFSKILCVTKSSPCEIIRLMVAMV